MSLPNTLSLIMSFLYCLCAPLADTPQHSQTDPSMATLGTAWVPSGFTADLTMKKNNDLQQLRGMQVPEHHLVSAMAFRDFISNSDELGGRVGQGG